MALRHKHMTLRQEACSHSHIWQLLFACTANCNRQCCVLVRISVCVSLPRNVDEGACPRASILVSVGPTQPSRGILAGPLMNFTKRSQAYPIACGPCLTALGGWTGWHSWLDCWVHKKTGAHLPKCPGVRFAFTSDPPSGRPQAKPAGHATFRSLSRVSDRYRGCFYSWGTHANYMGG
jgi:hypothetical protein